MFKRKILFGVIRRINVCEFYKKNNVDTRDAFYD